MGFKWGMIPGAALWLLAALVGVAAAAAPGMVVEQAKQNLAQENYLEARDQLLQAWQQGERIPEVVFYLGQANRLLLNYPQARQYLEEALRLRADFPEAALALADTLVALDQDLGRAQELLKKLEAAGYEPGRTALLLGMVAARQKQYGPAADYFRRAQADPRVAQEAKLQLGLALAAQNRLKEAKKELKEAVSLNPDTLTAGFGQGLAAGLDQRLKEDRPFHLMVGLGADFDSNVTLNPGNASFPGAVSGKGDAVFTQLGAMDVNLVPNGPINLWASYSFYQTFHPRLTQFDLLSHTFGVTPVYSNSSGRLWLPFTYNYSDVQSDKYYTAFAAYPTYLRLLTPSLGVEVGGAYARKYYWFPVNFPQDNRSSKYLGGSLGLYYFFKEQQGYLQARVSYEHDFAYGSNWDASGYRLLLAAQYPVSPRLKLRTFVDLTLAPYDHGWFSGQIISFFPRRFAVYPKREDQVVIYGAEARYALYKGLELNLHYYFVREDSNIPLYDYHRHVVGGQIGYRF